MINQFYMQINMAKSRLKTAGKDIKLRLSGVYVLDRDGQFNF